MIQWSLFGRLVYYIIYSGLMHILIYLIYLHFCFLDTLKNIPDDCRQHETNSHITHAFNSQNT